MSFRKLGIAVVLSSAFAFIACGDDSSSNSGETITCKIASKDPLVLDMDENGIHSTTTVELKENRLVETVKFDSNDHIPDSVFNEIFKQACDTYKQDPDYNDTTLSCSEKNDHGNKPHGMDRKRVQIDREFIQKEMRPIYRQVVIV
jgi:hypothetical protein